MLRAAVVIDYQNVHLTARDVFNPQDADHLSLVHPMLFARAAMQRRNQRQKDGYPLASVERVFVARGLPHSDHDAAQHARCSAQAAQWRSDGAIVELRDLKYDVQRGAGGRALKDIHGKTMPVGRGKEKGVDVLCALKLVRYAIDPDIDLVVLASRDTDLVPALDEVYDMRGQDSAVARVETFTWDAPDAPRRLGSLRPSGGRKIWNTNLDRRIFEASLDPRDYR